jgi:hypothetical protein
MPRDYTSNLGSARVSRVGERVLAIANFPCESSSPSANEIQGKACFDETPKPMHHLQDYLRQWTIMQRTGSQRRAGTWLPLLPAFLVQSVNFNEGDADRVVLPAHDCSITSWRKRPDNGALPIISRR